MAYQQLVNDLTSNPRRLFLIDGLGAVMSALMLGIVLVQFQSLIGIPKSTLFFLAALPCVFAIFDLYWWSREVLSLSLPLRLIAIVNIAYCVLSIGLAFYHINSITILGWVYIIIEVLIVFFIAKVELAVAGDLDGKGV